MTMRMSLRLCWAALALTQATAARWKAVPHAAYVKARRFLNLSSIFGSSTNVSPYDRIAGHPVFSVTTPWGSPYMNMEKLSDLEEVIQADTTDGSKAPQSLSEEQNEYRTVALYFLDPDDAVGVHGEMKQMDNMESADLRLTAFSLAKALRQASNLGNGLVTGLPPHAGDGKLKLQEGASLRYKIVPPKRQLYYAARCIGKERVGLFSESPAEDAQAAVMGNSALEGLNLVRRREQRERKTPKQRRTPMEAANVHMEGYTGIPVFYCPSVRRKLPMIKRLISGNGQEIPMFFNYEDMIEAWGHLRHKYPRKRLPEVPLNVEVFNLWDVLTSMDRDAWKKKQQHKLSMDTLLAPIRQRLSNSDAPDLADITFVPSSRSVRYKEAISARGNGKCRLRPMR